MLAEAIAKIVGLGQAAKQVEFVTHPGLPQSVFVRHGDEFQEKTVPPPLRQHTLGGFGDLVAALSDPAIAPAPEVYISASFVVALLDRGDRRGRVTVALEQSQRLAECMELESVPRKFSPRDAVKFLRMELHGSNLGTVIQALSRIDFKRQVGALSDVAHGRETLGRSVEAAVQQADAVPQEFHAYVPVWVTPGFSDYLQVIEFGLFLDMEAGQVEIRVLSDETTRAIGAALATAAADIRKALPSVPVFVGTP